MTKKVLLLTLVIIISIFVYTKVNRGQMVAGSFEECVTMGNLVGESYPRQCWTKDGKHFVEKVLIPQEKSITTRGEIACLPKTGNGPQTMECAIGLLAEDGQYYSLTNIAELDKDFNFSISGKKVLITGTLTTKTKSGPDGNKYNTAGDISIFSISSN